MSRTKTNAALAALGVAALLLASACASSGTTTATVVDRQGAAIPARMTWQTPSPTGAHGRLMVTLPDGETYVGAYQLVDEPDAMTTALWSPWHEGWPEWPLPWEGAALPGDVDVADRDALVQRYVGLVIANLESRDGERMRCRFGLLQPSVGLAGGLDGDCRSTTGARGATASLYEGLTGS